MKKILLTIASLAVAAVASVSVAPTNSEAVPAFARQTGAACLNCHFQAIPRLAAMGREFRANGFIDASVDLIEDDHLSLPVNLNASVLFKARIGFESNDATNNSGNDINLWGSGSDSAFQYPDEAALLLGGRVGETTGALVEWAGGPLSYKLIQIIPSDAGTIGIIMASTDALGAAYAFNDPSNALIRNTRGSQFRPGFLKNSSVQDAVSGYGAYFSTDSLHVGLGQFVRNGGTNIQDPAMQFGQGLIYARAAWKGDVAGFDTVAGFYSVSGSQEHAGGLYDESTSGVDVQMQGELGDALAGLYFVYQLSGDQSVGTAATDLAGVVTAEAPVAFAKGLTGYNLLGTYSVSHSTMVKVGLASSEVLTGTGTAEVVTTNDTFLVGAIYDVAQNFAIDFEYESTTKSDDVAGSTDVATTMTTILFEYVY